MKAGESEQSSNCDQRNPNAFEALKAKLEAAAIRSETGETVDGEEYLEKLIRKMRRNQ